MQLKTRDEIQAEIDKARGAAGFAGADDDAADQVMALCAPHAAAVEAAATGDGVGAIQFLPLIMLALQILPIIFGEGGFTIEKLQAVLQLILSIFTT